MPPYAIGNPDYCYLYRCDHPAWTVQWAQAQATGSPQSPWRLQLLLSSPCSVHWAIVFAQACKLQLWYLLLPVTAETLQHREDHRRQLSSNIFFFKHRVFGVRVSSHNPWGLFLVRAIAMTALKLMCVGPQAL